MTDLSTASAPAGSLAPVDSLGAHASPQFLQLREKIFHVVLSAVSGALKKQGQRYDASAIREGCENVMGIDRDYWQKSSALIEGPNEKGAYLCRANHGDPMMTRVARMAATLGIITGIPARDLAAKVGPAIPGELWKDVEKKAEEPKLKPMERPATKGVHEDIRHVLREAVSLTAEEMKMPQNEAYALLKRCSLEDWQLIGHQLDLSAEVLFAVKPVEPQRAELSAEERTKIARGISIMAAKLGFERSMLFSVGATLSPEQWHSLEK